MADDVLRQAVQGIGDIITTPGLINRDFSDIRSHHARHGLRHDGHRRCTGENASVEAAQKAINSPLWKGAVAWRARRSDQHHGFEPTRDS